MTQLPKYKVKKAALAAFFVSNLREIPIQKHKYKLYLPFTKKMFTYNN